MDGMFNSTAYISYDVLEEAIDRRTGRVLQLQVGHSERHRTSEAFPGDRLHVELSAHNTKLDILVFIVQNKSRRKRIEPDRQTRTFAISRTHMSFAPVSEMRRAFRRASRQIHARRRPASGRPNIRSRTRNTRLGSRARSSTRASPSTCVGRLGVAGG